MKNQREEIHKLEEIAQFYSLRRGDFNSRLAWFSYRTFKPFFKKGPALEIGPADGGMTQYLLKDFSDLSVVEAAQIYLENIQKLDPKIKIHISLIEDFNPPILYENIFLTHVLEHVVGPQIVLRRVRDMLTKTGLLFLVVPNAHSLHRQVGVKMGLLKKSTDLNEADRSTDHKRVYLPEDFRKEIKSAGLKIENFGGIFLKPLPSKEIEKNWSEELIEGFYQLGKDYPEICSEVYAVCSKSQS